MCPNNLRTKNSALMRGLSKIIWSLQLQIIQDTICQILLSNGLQLFCISTLAFFLSGPHNLFLLWEKKTKKSCKKSHDKLFEDGPTTNSICLFFCFCVHRQQVLRACTGWDKRHRTSADVRRYVRVFSLLLIISRRFKTCVWSLILTIKLLRGSKKEEETHKRKSCGRNFYLGEVDLKLTVKKKKKKNLHHPAAHYISCPTIGPLIIFYNCPHWPDSFLALFRPVPPRKLRHSSGDPDPSQALSFDWQPISAPLIGGILECVSQPN